MNTKLKGNFILTITAIIWGSSFVAQSVGMDTIEPNTFNGLRTILGAIVLLPVIFFRNKKQVKSDYEKNNKTLLIGGILCGILLCAASTIQTWGMKYTSASKSGFITAMYIIFVPFAGIIFGKKLNWLTVIGAISALAGLYLLCINGTELKINFGDLLTLICAVIFTLHIMFIDYFSVKTDGVKLSCIQFFTAGIINIILMMIFEKPDISLIVSCWKPICYSGIMSCGIGYTLQVIGQKYTNPASAAIIMSMESVFAAITGFLILREKLGVSELCGCIIMFAAILIVQLPDILPKKELN